MSHKGWNDPPTFSYDSFQENIGKKSQLTKRPDYTVDQLPKTSSQEAPLSLPTQSGPPKAATITAGISSVATPTRDKQQLADIDTLSESLREILGRCEKQLQKRAVDDIQKKLDMLALHWRDGKLSGPVKVSMTSLVDALAAGDHSQADQIHVKLMVDHISEVSQWMVGIKKLIAAVRTNSSS